MIISGNEEDTIRLIELEADCIIGIYKRERIRKQCVKIDLEMPTEASAAARTDRIRDALDYKRIAKSTLAFVRQSRFLLIETLAESIAGHLLQLFTLPRIRVTVHKPGAVRYSKDVSVSVLRYSRKRLARQRLVYISFGSNVQREGSIRRAIAEVSKEFSQTRYSSIYETRSIGMESKTYFWNLVSEVRTDLEAGRIKKKLQIIEKKLGRRKSRNRVTARTIDLDIIFCGHEESRTDRLRIPHPDAIHCAYMLLPMVELAPNFRHPDTGKTMIEHVGELLDTEGFFRKVYRQT